MPTYRTLAIIAAMACAACSPPVDPPGDPPGDKPPDPQATQLRDAIQAPIDKAKAVEGAVLEAGEAQRARIEAASD